MFFGRSFSYTKPFNLSTDFLHAAGPGCISRHAWCLEAPRIGGDLFRFSLVSFSFLCSRVVRIFGFAMKHCSGTHSECEGCISRHVSEKHRCKVGLLRFCFCFVSLPRDVGLIFSLDRQFRYEADSVCATGWISPQLGCQKAP